MILLRIAIDDCYYGKNSNLRKFNHCIRAIISLFNHYQQSDKGHGTDHLWCEVTVLTDAFFNYNDHYY